MSTAITELPLPDTQARQPQQQRARERFEKVLKASEALLLEKGMSGFSIPELAVRLDMTRASIYKFFPTPYAVLNELTKRELGKLEQALAKESPALMTAAWSEAIGLLVTAGARFYNHNPVASLLILGGSTTDESYQALELTIDRLGSYGRTLLVARGVKLPEPPPDVAVLAAEIVTTTYRLSYYLHGEITEAYRAEAAYAMEAYLSRYAAEIKF
ncbi:MAG: TetR/AcrR family transcriptional regulator [Nevskiales bacterium]